MTTATLQEARRITEEFPISFPSPQEKGPTKERGIEKLRSAFDNAEANLSRLKTTLEQKIEATPKSERIDEDEELTTTIGILEEKLKLSLNKLDEVSYSQNPHPLFATMETALETFVGDFQDLRWRILMHDGLTYPPEKKIISGKEEFLASLEEG